MTSGQLEPQDQIVSQNIRRSRGWMVFVGVMTIIGGALSVVFCLLGLIGAVAGAAGAGSFMSETMPYAGAALTAAVVFCLAGIIVGALSIWAAVLLFQAGSQADLALAGAGQSALVSYTGKLRTYFVIIGANAIIIAAGFLIFFIAVVAAAGQAGGFTP